jgi:hypothetical protein
MFRIEEDGSESHPAVFRRMPRVRFAAPGLAVVVGGDGGLIAGIF